MPEFTPTWESVTDTDIEDVAVRDAITKNCVGALEWHAAHAEMVGRDEDGIPLVIAGTIILRDRNLAIGYHVPLDDPETAGAVFIAAEIPDDVFADYEWADE